MSQLVAGFVDTGSSNYTSTMRVPNLAGGRQHLIELITHNLRTWTRALPETADAYRTAADKIATWTEPQEIRVANRRVFFIRAED